MFSVNQNKGFSLNLPNGWTVSVQFGGGNYCDHRSSRYDVSYLSGRGGSNWNSKTAEIAAFPTNYPQAKWYSFGREEEGQKTYVEGYQTVEEVLTFINTIRALPKVEEEEGKDGKDGKDGKEGKPASAYNLDDVREYEKYTKRLSLAKVNSLADAAWYESN